MLLEAETNNDFLDRFNCRFFFLLVYRKRNCSHNFQEQKKIARYGYFVRPLSHTKEIQFIITFVEKQQFSQTHNIVTLTFCHSSNPSVPNFFLHSKRNRKRRL